MPEPTATQHLSLHHLTRLDATPFELADAAAAGGFDMCGVRMVPVEPGEPVFDLVGDPQMRRRFARHLRERDVRLLDVEAVWIRPETDVDSLIPALEATAELGVQYLLTVGYDHERARLIDRLGRFADLAGEYGLTLPIEFITYSAITNLADAVDVIGAVGRKNLAVLVDFLQFFRAGAEWDVLAAIPASLLPYAQISDGPAAAPTTVEALRREARRARMIPGTGELDLKRLIAALPAGIPLSVEAPTEELAGQPLDAAARILGEATRGLLAAQTARSRS
ncbi:sugar phosphate isomerase/epimerase [Mycolicibacterium smegmatis]|nr:sugar phosphate isomerase/epimerase [Mycolicibacterium smegmatis]ULN28860.1 sugar phosphate isomerase/epimerase [Mycolicibacterium smegmatis]ULN35322.1 sugar phosphate isomerase/epimerase [Mycolicibacterium smegmatis]ULN70215.1 sugar phosphate isomerase/epimerase [Mycolicibacterium smegmatis]